MTWLRIFFLALPKSLKNTYHQIIGILCTVHRAVILIKTSSAKISVLQTCVIHTLIQVTMLSIWQFVPQMCKATIMQAI